MNEKISKKFSNSREELQKRISKALTDKKNIKNIDDIKKNLKLQNTKKANFNTIIKAANARTKHMANLFKNNINLSEIKDLVKKNYVFFDDNCSGYMVLGGIGDLLLVLAACYNQPNPKVLFLANNPRSQLVKNLFEFFNVQYVIYRNLMGTHWCGMVYDKFIKMPCFKTSAHLADGLNYGDWFNVEKYKDRLVTSPDWDKFIGESRLFEEKYVLLCPSGSWKGEARRRYLSLEEYRTIVAKLLQKKCKIVTTSDESDLKTYGLFPNQNCVWMTSDKIIFHDGTKKDISFKTFLQTINSADECVSMDTYLKTLVLLMNKKAKVIKTRFNGKYMEDGADSSDKIFLNKDIWPKIETYTLDQIFEEIDNF